MNQIVALAEGLMPLICEHRHTTEQDRRIAAPIEQAMRESDLGGGRSVGVLAHLEQHPALSLDPILR